MNTNTNYRLDTAGIFFIDCGQPCDHPRPCVPNVLTLHPDDTCPFIGATGRRRWTLVVFHAVDCPSAHREPDKRWAEYVMHRSVADLPTGISRHGMKPNVAYPLSLSPEQIAHWRDAEGDVSPLVGVNPALV